ncbi:extracellular solute-binding protein [Tessaracoccus sp. HDW20]|uniref:extracellular solute-binding protein n=1 Tax=Tessaracoccus coleopterorum TaxID=2714950 RepID=UPI0018D31C80|nr:extracellular solute-binding protein [Tessaracoccus coleopterorum]NHB83800.1 extracellular solute-binding protein [Tessaracoccus coleopterorum]
MWRRLRYPSSGATTGGGDSTDPANLETTISILAPSYSDSSEADWQKLIDEFKKTYPKVEVKLQIEGWDGFSEKVSARIQAGDYPDILNDNAFAGSADADLLYDITEVMSADTISAIEPSLLANGVGADGTQWAAPDIASARMLIYNTDLFTKAGITAPPKTWAEMEDAARKLVALGDGVVGYGMPLGKEEAQVESSLWLWAPVAPGSTARSSSPTPRRPSRPSPR